MENRFTIEINPTPEFTIELNEQGPQGLRGPQGLQGPQGPTGPQGPQGEVGPANTLTVGSVVKGEEAEVTIEGESPNQTINFVLPKGDKGDKGDQGIQGIQGVQGEVGPQGPMGPKGDKGDQGIQGPQGIQGIQGEIGPQGLQGPTGPQGPQGNKGDSGVSVVGVEEISKVGLVATYRMHFSDGTHFDYEVTDGSVEGVTREQVISLIGYEPASYTSVEGLTTRVGTLEGRVEDLTVSRANVSLSNLDEVGENRFTDIQYALDSKQDKGNYALKSEIPTNNNQLTNGAGYITSDYHDSTKQDKLTGTQLNAVNSGINSNKVATYDGYATNKANTNLSNLTEDGIKVIKDNSGSGLEICDIGMALYVDETKGLRRYLNGQIVDVNTNTQAFLNRLKEITTLHPSLLCTEEEWQTAKTMSAFGQVGKFVFNYSVDEIVSVRIPAIVNVQGLFDLQNLGMTVAESLPNITGISSTIKMAGTTSSAKGAITETDVSTSVAIANGSVDDWRKLNFNASNSSSTYQDNAPVQQEAIQYPYFIQIATGSETENNIINEIELNNPYSLFDSKYSDHELNNLSWLKSEGQWNAKVVYPTAYDKLLKVYNGTETVEGLSVKLSTETYTDYDFVLNIAEEAFRLPLKTNLASGKAVVGNGMTLGFTNGTSNLGLAVNGSNGNADTFWLNAYGQPVGTIGTNSVTTPNRSSIGVTTDATKSGIELSDSGLYLYFYVGETVQNANLIDAGRIGEQLANKVDTSNTQWAINACMPDYANGIVHEMGTATSATFTAPTDGLIWISVKASGSGAISNATINGNVVMQAKGIGSGYTHTDYGSFLVSKGDIIVLTSPGKGDSDNGYRFFPLKGVN